MSISLNSCMCTGACLNGGGCSAFPHGRNQFIGYTHPLNSDNESLRQQINAQESTINHTQQGIEKCFERVEKIEYVLGDVFEKGQRIKIQKKEEEQKPYQNIFEFIAVDPKRRDDIRHVKNALYEFYCWILDNVQDNKYRSNGIDLLEAAAMQLNKAISRRKDNGT